MAFQVVLLGGRAGSLLQKPSVPAAPPILPTNVLLVINILHSLPQLDVNLPPGFCRCSSKSMFVQLPNRETAAKPNDLRILFCSMTVQICHTVSRWQARLVMSEIITLLPCRSSLVDALTDNGTLPNSVNFDVFHFRHDKGRLGESVEVRQFSLAARDGGIRNKTRDVGF